MVGRHINIIEQIENDLKDENDNINDLNSSESIEDKLESDQLLPEEAGFLQGYNRSKEHFSDDDIEEEY